MDKVALLAPYIGLASTIIATTVAAAIYFKKRGYDSLFYGGLVSWVAAKQVISRKLKILKMIKITPTSACAKKSGG